MTAQPLPWEQGEPILAAVTAHAGDDREPPPLPDEPPFDPTAIRWGPGSWEGVAARHIGGPDGQGLRARLRRLVRRRADDGPGEAVRRLRRLVEEPDDDARVAVYRLGEQEDLLNQVDPILERVVADPDLRTRLAPHARWLVAEGRHRGPVKLGVALLGVSGAPRDADTLVALAQHDEFTLYCAVAIQHLLPDATDALWDIARGVHGWGRIEAVQRLAPLAADRPDIRRWLLTDGCRNAIMDEYLAYTCAVAGELADALTGDVDEPLLDGACTIVAALCDGGPAEDLGDYDDAPAVLDRLLALLERRCTTLERLHTVVAVQRWVAEHGPPELRGRTERILADPAWPDRLRAAFADDDRRARGLAWEAAPHVGVDLWDAGFARLQAGPLDDGLVYQLMARGDLERRRRMVRWAEAHLPLDGIATGPAEHLFPAPDGAAAQGALVFVVQELGGAELYSEALVAAALQSPVISSRNMALGALEATPPEHWGAAVHDALARLAAEDPVDQVRERAQAAIRERAGS